MKKSRIYDLFIVLGIALLAACAPQQEVIRTEIVKADTLTGNAGEGLLYALPMTTFTVEVEATQISYKKGPYSAYAKSLLDIDNVIDRDRTEWILGRISVRESTEPDPGEYYQVVSNAMLRPVALHLNEKGLLLMLNPASDNDRPATMWQMNEPLDGPFFPVKNLKGMKIEYRDTGYRTLSTDTGFIEVPVTVVKERIMTQSEKAQDAAETLIKIRKRRFRLISRNNSDIHLPDGPGLEFAVHELDRMEQEYLALFTGKKIRKTYRYRFVFTPSDSLEQPFILFRFLPALGVLPPEDLRGDAVEVLWQKIHEPKIRIVAQKDSLSPGDPMVTYRIPQPVLIRITYGRRTLFSRNAVVYQLGTKTAIPSRVIFQEEALPGKPKAGLFR